MCKDCEGRTEAEALQKAREELGLKNDDVYVEVLEEVKKTIFKKGYVKIRVYYGEDGDSPVENEFEEKSRDVDVIPGQVLEAENDLERKTVSYISTLINKMGYEASVTINYRKDNKIGINIDSPDSSIIIGRKGKNLDAIQLLANVYAGNIDEDVKIVVDSENYRMRHEEQIVRTAYKAAEYVKRTGRSKLLDPMNPFERRLVHTALNDFKGVDTKSEGEGLYKQVRIIPFKESNR